MRIVHTVNSLKPDHGGPSRSVPELCKALANEEVSVNIVTYDHPGLELAMLGDAVVPVPRADTFSAIKTSLTRKDPFEKILRSTVASASPCVLHDHGLWLKTNSIAAGVARSTRTPLVLSPRGMLNSWALKYKRMKKRIAWLLYQRRNSGIVSVFHATSEEEVQDIRRAGLHQPVALIPNGVKVPEQYKNSVPRDHKRHVLFLSRFHPKKGLSDLVDAWSLARPEGWDLSLAGPDVEGHRKKIEQQIRAKNLADEIRCFGPANDLEKWELYRRADLFVLPSYGENFGIVVAEALAAGIPVIATKATPWSVLLRERCGWWVDIGADALASALREAISLSDTERYAMGQRGRTYVQENLSWQHIAQKMMAVYAWMLGNEPLPPFVVVD